ncbi:MAG: alpha-amylase [Chloroflexi bacterium]|nr:alpha-amylase [Chloroflexota bacterium]
MLITRASRMKFNFSADFFRPDGHVVFSDLTSARAFASQMSARRSDPTPASDLYALSLLDEAYHALFKHFFSRHTGVMGRAMGVVQSSLGSKYDLTLGKFIDEFPPLSVFRGEVTAGVYLVSRPPHFTDFGRGVRAATVEDVLLVDNFNANPACQPYKILADESVMNGSSYKDVLRLLKQFFARQPGFGSGESSLGDTLIDILSAPIAASPDSLEGQLRYIIAKWGYLLDESFSQRMLRGVDYLHEETIRHHFTTAEPAKAEVHVPVFSGSDYADAERYSPDKDWMPRLVLLAKNTYVWLGQLSKKYQREINTLDQIPNEELDLLASRGFTGLWLIGLWERSQASKRIKQRMGQEDAVASAYSLHSYDIAGDLGGWDALSNLRSRAWERGIRLSADMVPNHMGIDSTWVIEHPDRFLSVDQPPYPSYSFNSENLSIDSRAAIVLEDHYYDRSDAAVVFKLHNYQTNKTTHVYHGNDGTSFPWNDTAQIDYTNTEAREAVIQVILHVARNFPVIRFDAAMTLAKKHIQRLWFPQPGDGGAIPSRSQYGMTRAGFDEKIPVEFWREVVDRVAAEVPDTLLLAEAFWLMEGYFVRTLGMHRVYNSAFMHMLRDEDNAKYRMAIRNTLEFDPQILKRYVNFMSNPDEKTAVEQFGTGDKYFGICALLATLPGLPMFGHGQIEGFGEKYGMEYRTAKQDESVDEGLVRGHEGRIFPLLHRRYLFADVEQFLLFDFISANGHVNEDVFAYCNRHEKERGLVVYHNKFADTRGRIKVSAAYLDKSSGKSLRRDIAEGLGLRRFGYVIFKDYVTRLEYIRSCMEIWENGLFIELGAYQCHTFMDFRFVNDDYWKTVCDSLNGAGVPSIQERWEDVKRGEEAKIRAEALARVAGVEIVKGETLPDVADQVLAEGDSPVWDQGTEKAKPMALGQIQIADSESAKKKKVARKVMEKEMVTIVRNAPLRGVTLKLPANKPFARKKKPAGARRI